MKFALLASGSKGNCCVIRDDESSIIIDCGTTKKYLQACFEKLQYDYLKSDALFITHTHKDHVAQLKMFDSIATYSKSELMTNYFTPLSNFEEVFVNTLKVTEIPLSHDAESTSGFMVENEDTKLVYITDTGYVKEEYIGVLKNADYYIFESNHDVEMLMQTQRPMYIKQRILGDKGHLCNEDSAEVLAQLVGEKTKEIVLAHISEEGNHHQKAKQVLQHMLHKNQIDHSKIKITPASQFEIVIGGGKQKKECE